MSSSRKQLVHKRNARRKRCKEIFKAKKELEAQKQALDEEFDALQLELMELDERIEQLEEEHQDEETAGDDSLNRPQSSQSQHQPMLQQGYGGVLTMNPEEILPEQSQYEADGPLPFAAAASALANRRNPLDVDDDEPHQPVSSSFLAFHDDPILTQPQCTQPTAAEVASNRDDGDDRKMAPQGTRQQRASPALAPLFVQQTSSAGKSASLTSSCPYSTEQISEALQSTFQIQKFRENQLEIIRTTLSNQDCFVIMRTGGGKSLTYQLPVVLERTQRKVTLVISPLLSLIQDQQQQMNQFVPNSCVSFTSGMGTAEHTANWQRVRDPEAGVGMIIVTPEKVHKSNKLKSELEKLYKQGRLSRFVIDECHCACQWGHDFRPDYAKLGQLKSHFPSIPVLAVTATASARVRQDCVQILRISRNYQFYRSSANRPNLTYQVRPKLTPSQVIDDMVEFIQTKHNKSPGIIYTYSRKDADTVAEQLREHGIESEAYHSDVSASQKNQIHYSWMHNVTQVVVATIAFGLGINKPDVRFVLHHTLSKTLEAYYQESGRAGRDGRPADCVLYFAPKDVPRMIRMVYGESSESLFMHMVQYAQRYGTDQLCRAQLLHHLGDKVKSEVTQLLDSPEEANHGFIQTRNVASHAKTLLQLLFSKQSENLTLPMLVKEWRAKPASAPDCVQNNPPGKDLSVSDCEHIIVALLVDGFIDKYVKYTAYDTAMYLRCAHKAETFLIEDRAVWNMRLPKPTRRKSSSRKSGDSTSTAKTTSTTAKKPAARRKSAPAATTSVKRKRTVRKKQPASRKRKAPTKKKASSSAKNTKRKSAPAALAPLNISNAAPDIIEVDDDSSLSEIEDTLARKPSLSSRPQRGRQNVNGQQDPLWWDKDDDSDEENEFDG